MIVCHLTDTDMSIYKISLSLSLPPPTSPPHPTLRHRNLCAGLFLGGGGGGGGGVVQLSVRRSMHSQESSDSLLVFR